MKELSFEVGDKAWCYLSIMPKKRRFPWDRPYQRSDGELHEGLIVHKFQHEGRTLYVLEFETSIDPIYECQCGFTLSDGPDKSIGAFRW